MCVRLAQARLFTSLLIIGCWLIGTVPFTSPPRVLADGLGATWVSRPSGTGSGVGAVMNPKLKHLGLSRSFDTPDTPNGMYGRMTLGLDCPAAEAERPITPHLPCPCRRAGSPGQGDDADHDSPGFS